MLNNILGEYKVKITINDIPFDQREFIWVILENDGMSSDCCFVLDDGMKENDKILRCNIKSALYEVAHHMLERKKANSKEQ